MLSMTKSARFVKECLTHGRYQRNEFLSYCFVVIVVVVAAVVVLVVVVVAEAKLATYPRSVSTE